MKKILSVLLCLMVVISMLVIAPVSTNAQVAPGAADRAVQWAIETANDDSHGYSQGNRFGNPDYDCASFVVYAYRAAGFKLPIVAHCGNLKQEFEKEGFTWIPNTEIDLSTSKYLKPGDILLRISGHTEIYIGNNMQCGAHQGTYDDYDYNDPGDSTGKEVCPVTYSNRSNWSGILRYEDEPVDIGTDFYAYIQNNYNDKVVTNDSDENCENRNARVRSYTGASNQIWKFERQSDGSYKITSIFNGLALDVTGAGTTSGTNVGVYFDNDKPAQRWYVYGSENSYKICSQCNTLSLDAGGGTQDGTNLRMCTDNASSAQRFKIVKLNPPQSTHVDVRAGTPFELTSIWWNMTLYADSYDVKIYKSGDTNVYKEINDVMDTYVQVDLPAGDYTVEVYSKNIVASTKSMNTLNFTIEASDEYSKGDVDTDGTITVLDATAIQLHLAHKKPITSGQQTLADIDNDNEVTVLDATKIQLFIANKIDSLT